MLSRKFMSVKRAADLMQVGETTISNWIHAGDLPAINVGCEWRIAPKDLESFLETRRAPRSDLSAENR